MKLTIFPHSSCYLTVTSLVNSNSIFLIIPVFSVEYELSWAPLKPETRFLIAAPASYEDHPTEMTDDCYFSTNYDDAVGVSSNSNGLRTDSKTSLEGFCLLKGLLLSLLGVKPLEREWLWDHNDYVLLLDILLPTDLL